MNAPLQYQGPPRNNITRLSGTSTTITPTDTYRLADTNAARVAVGFVYGVDHWGYTSTGIPKEIPGSVLIANGGGDQFFCGSKRIAGYSNVQVDPALTKIKRITGD